MEDDIQQEPEPTPADFVEDPVSSKPMENFVIGNIQADIAGYEEISDNGASFEDEEGTEGDVEAAAKQEKKDEFQDEMDYDEDEWFYKEDDAEIPMGI